MHRILPTFLALIVGTSLSAQLTMIVDAIPSNTPEGDPIHVAGDFQGWDPSSPDYQLSDMGDGTYQILLNITPGLITFKFTRGGWDTVEGNENGGFLPDRTYSYGGGEETVNLQILSWEDVGGTNSTAAENVSVMDDNFYIPQLDRERRIWIYLPPNYDQVDDHYKVLYMQDGQNLFDIATSFAGEWQVDETLNDLFTNGDEGCIVVGIENGGLHRIDEYSPWVNPEYGGGQGAEYMEFIVNTLKPYIDENYRTKPEREWTGIMGSSLGGLISTYGGVEHSGVFSRIGTFSPSYWFSSDEAYNHVATTPVSGAMRIYSIAGEQEGSGMVAGVNFMETVYTANGYTEDEHIAHIHSYGTHSESYWAGEFEDAYLWLWSGTTDISDMERDRFTVFPNPASDSVNVQYHSPQKVVRTEVCNYFGQTLRFYEGMPAVVDLKGLEAAVVIVLHMEDNTVLTQQVIRK